MKLPGHEKFTEGIIRDGIKEFHENIKKDFNPEVKNKIFNNLEVINLFTSNKKTIQPILETEFIRDLNKACDLAAKDSQVSALIGLTYKNMPIKPSILINVENILGKYKIDTYIEEIKDYLYIEDLSGRILIQGNYSQFKNEEFISDIPISIKGKLNQNNIFLFDDFLFYKSDIDNDNKMEQINSQEDNNKEKDKDNLHEILSEKLILGNNETKDNKNLILFISNLKLGKLSEYEEGLKPSIRGLLIDFIQNKNNINNTLYQYSKKISRIILVGISLNTFEKEIEKKILFTKSSSPSFNDINKKIIENFII